jgi:hypothetical protein
MQIMDSQSSRSTNDREPLWGPLKEYGTLSAQGVTFKVSGMVISLTIHTKGQSFELDHVLKFIGMVIRLTINTKVQSFET